VTGDAGQDLNRVACQTLALIIKMADLPESGPVLIKDVTIITVDAARRVILKGCILTSGSRVLHVSSAAPESLPEGTRVISLPGRIVIPGLINTHAHLAQSLLRGLAEDLPLHSWLCDRIWPLEAAYGGEGDSADGYIAARTTIAEMLLSGTTCFLEAMLTHGSGFANVARAVSEMGIRACLVRCTSSFNLLP
jgi:cytosine/adenosine deaminase-related metal-dependent hydrolase